MKNRKRVDRKSAKKRSLRADFAKRRNKSRMSPRPVTVITKEGITPTLDAGGRQVMKNGHAVYEATGFSRDVRIKGNRKILVPGDGLPKSRKHKPSRADIAGAKAEAEAKRKIAINAKAAGL